MTQRKRASGFVLMDAAFSSDPKFVRLARNTEPVQFAAAVGVWWMLLADCRRAKSPLVDWDDYSEYAEQIGQLRDAKLLDEGGFDPESFDRWAPAYRSAAERKGTKGNGEVPEDTEGTESTKSTPPSGQVRSGQVESNQVTSTDNGNARAPDEVPEGWDAPDAIVAYHEVTQRYPSDAVIDWLNRLSNDHPEEAIARILAEQYAADPNLGTLLSRTDAALKLDVHRRAKAEERARAKARSKAEAPHRQMERVATPEEREQAAWVKQALHIKARNPSLPIPETIEEVRAFVERYAPGFRPQVTA